MSKQNEQNSKVTRELEKHYNKFCEDKRLTRRHGQVEYITTMQYIKKYLADNQQARVLDVGAGTGRYSIPLSKEGYDVTAIELVKYNLGILKSKKSSVCAVQGTALDLSRFEEESFDAVLVFGPMYHLFQKEDKLKALQEAKRVTKKGGLIFVAYIMNEYSIITHGFKEGFIKECIEANKVTPDFHVVSQPEDLYDYVRLEDINELNALAGLTREKIIAADGHANYMRKELNAMSEEVFQLFIQYHLMTCERQELLGASSHTLDILRNI